MIRTKEKLNYYLERDRLALGIPNQNLVRRIKNILYPNLIWRFEKTLRKTEYYYTRRKNPITAFYYLYYRFLLRKRSLKLGFSIPLNVFGPGLSIAHYGTIVVNGNSHIGENCRLHTGVNIGASGGSKEAPQLGDNVYIGPGAILFGNIKIANNVSIGANATVNKSCNQENVILAGTPAKIVRMNSPNWLAMR